MNRYCWLGLFTVLLISNPGQCDELPEGILCPVSGQDVDPEVHVNYREGKVYFCCEKCVTAFEKDSAPFATKSNLQLVLTHQAVQRACPITGKSTKEGVTASVGGVDVGLCCGNCQKKVNGASEDEKLELAFGDSHFEKAFEVTGSDE
jgi:hypothetical protein